MNIEIQEEIADKSLATTLAQDGISLELLEKHGLTGQKRQTDRNGEFCKYRPMTIDEYIIYSVLFPCAEKVEDYDQSVIPHEVLVALDSAKGFQDGLFFKQFHVWYCPTKLRVDPILVGYREKDYQTTAFLIARWGDALAPLDTLRKKAAAIIKMKAEMAMLQLGSIIKDIEGGAFSLFSTISPREIESGFSAGDLTDLPIVDASVKVHKLPYLR